ncbi:head maturation protease [Arthrobacter phage Beans]|uniref:Capsid maturation protease n=1 Tax=Arthrobacter phage Beans TaxID=2015815 RepID=A0A222ZJU6_9CAUD|nr:head maturation protease [Arthrobacter phage Beans]ASR84685.1 capsid maturation protease [Arthrobacter phage Beans]
MCQLCATAQGELLLAEMERELVLAESDAGLSTPTAVRPLNANERRAMVRFGDIDDMERMAESRAATALIGLRAEVNDALLDDLFAEGDAVRPQQVADKLTTLLQQQPERVGRAVQKAQAAMVTILRDVYAESAKTVIDEAKRQGSNVKLLDDARLRFAETDSGIFDALGAAVASYFWQRVTGVLQKELLSPARLMQPSMARDDAETIVASIDPAGAMDQAAQAIHAARGAGRYDQAEEFEPEEIWASELMDGRTCRPCELVDGKEYATLAEARVEYESGGYGACKGGARCRGTLVMIYGDPPVRPAEPEPKPEPVAPEPKPKTPRKRTAAPKPADSTAEPKPKTPRKPPGLPSPPLPTHTPVKPLRPVDPDGRQRFFSLRELPIKKSNAILPGTVDNDIVKHLTPAKRAAAKRLAKASGLLDEAKLVNPLNKTRSAQPFAYTSNCSNCVTAYEMRRRGYDVNAAMIYQDGRRPRDFVDAWWSDPEGGSPSMEFVSSRRGLESWAEEFPDGSRGFVTCAWKNAGGGHVFSWEKVDGKIVYIEPQTPDNPNGERHWASIKPESVMAVRIDDMVPSDAVTEALEIKGKK